MSLGTTVPYAGRSHLKAHALEAVAAFLGLDWAAAKHESWLQAAGSDSRAFLVREHSPEALDAWVQTLRPRFHGQPVAVCLALNTGPLVSALRHSAFLGLFPVHPFTLAKDREAFTPSRANDAPTDAELQVERLLKHRDKRTPLTPHSSTRRAVTQRVEHRRRLVGDTVRGTNRVTSALKHDFPHGLPWFQEQDPRICCDVLSRGPTLKAAPLARRTTREPVFRAPHVRSADVSKTRIDALKRAVALTTARGGIPPNALLGQALVAPLRVPWQAITAVDTASADHAQGHPDVPLVDPLPGAGAVFAPRLLGAVGEQRKRDASAEELPKSAGLAPVTARRGKKSWGHWRLQCPKCLWQTFVEWAAESIRHACWAQASYQPQRAKGKAHQAAVRAFACNWLRML
jgi:hypothetical protein